MRCCAPVILREAIAQYGGNIDGVPGYEDALETTPICKHPTKAEAHDLVLSILGIPSSSGGRAATKAIGVTTKKKVEVSAKKKASKKVGVTANVGCQKVNAGRTVCRAQPYRVFEGVFCERRMSL